MKLSDRIPPRIVELAQQVAPSHTALLMVDMQNDFASDDGIFVQRWTRTSACATSPVSMFSTHYATT